MPLRPRGVTVVIIHINDIMAYQQSEDENYDDDNDTRVFDILSHK